MVNSCLDQKVKRKKFIDSFRKAYSVYYADQLKLFDSPFTPNSVCRRCYIYITQWLSGKRDKMAYGTPMMWIENPNGHHDTDTCYGCVNHVSGMNEVNTVGKIYSPTIYASLPQPHSDANPQPQPHSEAKVAKVHRLR